MSSSNDAPSNNSSSSSPPSPSQDKGSESPPSPDNSGNSSSSSSPPPPQSAPPPQKSEDKSPPPPPTENQSPPPPQKSDGNGSSPPQSSNNNSSPPPPHSSSQSPPSNGSSHSKSPPPPNHNPSPHKQLNNHSGGDKNEGSSSKSGGLKVEDQLPLIIGVTVGVVAFLIIMVLIFVACSKKKKRRNEPMHYYMDTGPKGSASGYYHSSQHQNWQNSQMDHVIKMNQSGMSSGPPNGWLQPPPPPPGMISSEMSSAYSGPRQPVLPPPSPNVAFGFNQSTFTYEEIAAATNGFSQANLLGQGGFGYVHKGVLPNGKVVAVKSLKSGSGQGEREFQAEVDIISRVHHRHLVSLVGYCIAGGQRMLVYEFVPNNTLEYHLHGKGRPVMEWSNRVTIAMGAAKGLAYLHEDCHPRIIHRDIKTANILIDDNWEAMVADFGLAKLNDTNVTHVSTRVMGTFGYLAPEYASSGKLTEKSDVFSYGVMLLELITGRRPVDTTDQYMEDSLVDWARPILTRAIGDGDYEELVDPRLEDNYNPSELARMVACAAASVRHSARRRPKMSQIVRALEGDVSLDDLNEVVRGGTSSSSDYDTVAYNADMKKFRNLAMNSQEYTSSEYGASTGEHGRKNSTSSSSEVSNSRDMGRSRRG